MILKGILKPNNKFPSVRKLSSILLISPNTTGKAYQELERQGIITTMRGKGTFVSENISLKANDERVNEIKQSLKLHVLEATYLGIDKETLQQWITTYLNELRSKVQGIINFKQLFF